MPSSYSTNLKIELQATGENSGTWGTITNTNLGTALEQAIVGYGNPSYASDANLTLTYTDTNAAQAARALVLNVTSAVSLTATRELVVPTIQKQYIVQNNTTGSQSITVKTSAGTGITVPNGRKAHLYVDGTNVIYMDDYVDINGGAIDGTPVGANSASTGAFTTLSATGNVNFDGGTFTFNDSGADKDFRVEGDTDANLFFSDASTDRIGIGTNTPATKLDVNGTITATAINTTTLDLTNLEVTNIKAKDGTAAMSIADSTGIVTVTAAPVVSALTASQAVFTTSGKALISNAITGSGNVVMSASPTLTGTIDAAAQTLSGNLTLNGGTANGVLYLNGSKVATSGSALTFDGAGLDLAGTNLQRLGFVNASAATDEKTYAWQSGSAIGNGVFRLRLINDAASDGVNAYVIDRTGTSIDYQAWTAATTEGMRLTSTGLGIGTSSPGAKLHVLASNLVNIFAGTNANSAYTEYRYNSTTVAGYIGNGSSILSGASDSDFIVRSEGALKFNTNGNNARVTIDTSGNLGLGVTPSAQTSGVKSFELQGVGSGLLSFGSVDTVVTSGAYYSATGWRYSVSSSAVSTYYQQAGAHKWFTAPSGTAGNAITFTQALTLDASGNLLVGLTSPSAGSRLEVRDSTNCLIRVTATSGLSGIDFGNTSDADLGRVRYDLSSNFLTFSTNKLERARITSGGDLLVGTTAAYNSRLVVVPGTTPTTVAGANQIQIGEATENTGYRMQVGYANTTGSGYSGVLQAYAASSPAPLYLNDAGGNIYASSIYSATVGGSNRDVYVDSGGLVGYVSSTRASKTNISNITNISWLLQLNPVSFNYRKKDKDGKYTDETDGPIEYGLIAEDTEAVKPELCFYDEVDGNQELRGISYSKLITPMLKLLQEQQAMINELKAKVAALESK